MHAGMGGLSIATPNPYHFNPVNPAAFSSLRSTAFETSLFAKRSSYASAGNTQNIWSGNVGYLALGVPLRNPVNEALDRNQSKWRSGMGILLTPVTTVGYRVETADSTNAELGRIVNRFNGSGGLYKVGAGWGTRYKNTALGVSAGWVFGANRYEAITSFTDQFLNAFDNVFTDKITYRGFVWNAGLMHDINLEYGGKEKDQPLRWITLGLTAESSHGLNADASSLRLRSRGLLPNGTPRAPDTLASSSLSGLSVTLPPSLGFGFHYTLLNKFQWGAQASWAGWSAYRNAARPESLRDVFEMRAGGEWIPDHISYNRYMKRVRYRVGAYYRQDPRRVNGQAVDDLGVTLGFGLPLILPRQQTSFVNIAVEAGQVGGGSAIRELYGRITAGFTLNDNTWFFKRRFE